MRISYVEDRKRMLFSFGPAVILHIAVLAAIGLGGITEPPEPEFGPITVQITPQTVRERAPEPVPEPEQAPVETFETEEAPVTEPVPEPEPLPEPVAAPEPAPAPAPTPEPVKVPQPVTPSVPVRPAAAAAAAPAEADDDILEAIRRRSSGSSGGLDARSVFGDDPVPATADNSTSAAASFFTDEGEAGSSVVLSDTPQATRDSYSGAEDSSPADVSVVDSSDWSSLDSSLTSAAAQTEQGSADAERNAQVTEIYQRTSAGDSAVVSFRDPASSRELLKWDPPVIPEDVQRAGISKYTVVIEFDIDADGVTSGAHLARTSGDSRIDAAVQSALRSWIFEESRQNGKKVRATLTYVIEIK